MRSWLPALALLTVLGGCTYDDTFAVCPLSKQTLENCKTIDNALFSCVVRDHPQCSENICLSWAGQEARCTQTCKPGTDTCPGGSKCSAYTENSAGGEGEYFCVQDEFLQSNSN